MRIIGGKYRGKQLIAPSDSRVRPTTDMVKENIFNIIQFDVLGARVLDLFAGSGAIGIEALSRGAAYVTFVDSAKDSLAVVDKNLSQIKAGDSAVNCSIMHSNYRDMLLQCAEKFDLIYLDPPYNMLILDEVLSIVKKRELLSDNGIVVYESLNKTNRKSGVKGFSLLKSKKYGTVAVDIYINQSQNAEDL